MSSRAAPAVSGTPIQRTVSVLAILVCHDGDRWLPEVLESVRGQAPRPRRVVAVDTGSTDGTPELLAAATEPGNGEPLLDAVLTLGAGTGYAEALAGAVSYATERWGDPGQWLWLLHDDSAPAPGCLGSLLVAADASPSAGVLGPLAVDWYDPRMVVAAGLSTDASGHRQTGVTAGELATRPGAGLGGLSPEKSPAGSEGDGYRAATTEVLAVPSAGALVRRQLWERLGGFDTALPLFGDDVDFGWRANRAGALVLCVPASRVRHVRAAAREERATPALGAFSSRAAARANGLRAFLVNCGALSYLIGLPRLTVLCLLRAVGFAMVRRHGAAVAELAAAGYLLSGRARLRSARAARRSGSQERGVGGLLTSRLTRLRNAVSAGMAGLIRRRVATDAALGGHPGDQLAGTGWTFPEPDGGRREARGVSGPDAVPAGALGRPGRSARTVAGLRRPAPAMAVPVPSPRPRSAKPSPGPRAAPELVLVDMSRARLFRELVLSPPLVLFAVLGAVSVLANLGRLSVHLAGGALLLPQPLAATWAEYVAAWHPVAGGTSAAAPAALAVLGVLGAPFADPQVAASVLLLGDAPIAGVLAYLAARRMRVRRWTRALLAAGYALMPVATEAVAQGRLAAVVAHLLLPLVLAGVFGILFPHRLGSGSWLSRAVLTALGIAVIGAFTPLVHLIVLALALLGFVLVPATRGEGRRRVAALFVVVLLPIALLLPWPAALLRHPALVLGGVGAGYGTSGTPVSRLVALTPPGPGAWPYLGGTLLLAVLLALATRPVRGMLAGFAVAALGVAGVVAVRLVPVTPVSGTGWRHAWAGTPLVVVAAGLFLVLLAACERPGRDSATQQNAARRVPLVVRAASLAGVAFLLALVAGDLVAGGSGPLGDRGGARLAAAQHAEAARTGRGVLVVGGRGEPSRVTAGRTAAFGDDSTPAVAGAPQRIERWADGLTSGDRKRVRRVVAQAVASGVLFVVLPDDRTAARVRDAAGSLIAPVPDASVGRRGLPAVRLLPAGGPVTLYSPELSHRAVTGGTRPVRKREIGDNGVVGVTASLPDVGASVSQGSRGRLLVLGAEYQSSWRATVDGKPAPVVEAWGHLAAVSVPQDGGDIRVFQPATLRDVLLLAQAAAVLFTLLTAIPTRRKDT